MAVIHFAVFSMLFAAPHFRIGAGAAFIEGGVEIPIGKCIFTVVCAISYDPNSTAEFWRLAETGSDRLNSDQETANRATFTEPCRRTSPRFDLCMKKALQALIPKLGKRGIPELELESIDPLRVPEMIFNFDSLQDVKGKLMVNETIATGMTTIKITDVRSDIVEGKSFNIDIDYAIEKIEISGKFSMGGRVGDYPVSGAGPYNITVGQVTGTWELRGTQIEDDGEAYIKVTDFHTSPSVGYFKIHADDIVNGSPELSQGRGNARKKYAVYDGKDPVAGTLLRAPGTRVVIIRHVLRLDNRKFI
ncbi:hypothetical protein AAG570_010364 [Ranatra chinensis]|uniref:Uncharacterized protein n=1 Tax=Ranatra chinensis TaxID=642074 RepID=A0ABD0YPH9_9HEMI